MTHTDSGIQLRPFQHRFISGAFAPGIDISALSLPRGNGKSALAGHLVARAMTPGDGLCLEGKENVLAAASIEQGRIVYKFARDFLEGRPGYRFQDAAQRIGIVHVPTNTRTRVISSSGKTAMGLGADTNLTIVDEPGSMEVIGGQLLNDAIDTSLGKAGASMRVTYIGTLAPSVSGWWHELIDGGCQPGIYVQALRGDPKKWDQWHEIRRCNPLVDVDPKFRRKLLQERDAARSDPRLKARFLSFRLNHPSPDERTVLLTRDDWERVMARDMPPRRGPFAVGVDLGGGRAWSAAVAVWLNGRVEATAVAPGIPDLEAQEKRDRVPRGTYVGLRNLGVLKVADGLRVQPPGQLLDAVRSEWGSPNAIICDHFRLAELQDCNPPCPVIPRRAMWSQASEDIRACRQLAADGPLACSGPSSALIAASLSVAVVQNDTSGNSRLVKSSNNTSRDDVCAALLLAGGAVRRERDSGRTGSTGTGAIVVH